MIEVVVGIVVERPAGEVFAFLADWTNNPQWQDGMVACTWTSEPPLQVGSTYDQEARFLGRRIVSSFEVVEHEPGRRVRIVTTQSTMPLDITREVESLGDERSRVTATIRGGPEGLLSLADPLTERMVRRNVEADYERLREVLEGRSTRRRPAFGQEYRSGIGYLQKVGPFSRRPRMQPIGPPDEGWPDHPLRAEPDGTLADWWVDHYAPWTHPGVGAFIPDVFDAYAVILHPFHAAQEHGHRSATWREVADATGRSRRDLLDQFEPFIEDLPAPFHEPSERLEAEPARALLPHLGAATRTPDDVLVARWIGFGGEALDLRFPGCALLETQGRGHALLRGGLDDVLTGIHFPRDVVDGVWWPADRAWLVHTEVDGPTTEIAGSRELIDALLADDALEVVEVTHTTDERDHL